MKYRPKSGPGSAPVAHSLHTSPFIDKYVAFLESQGRRFDKIAEFKNTEFFRIQKVRPSMPVVSDAELLETTDTYIRLHKMSELTNTFIYPTPSEFFTHYFEIVNSKSFKKDVENIDVERSLSDPQIKEQIEFILEHLTLSWGDKFPPETRVRLSQPKNFPNIFLNALRSQVPLFVAVSFVEALTHLPNARIRRHTPQAPCTYSTGYTLSSIFHQTSLSITIGRPFSDAIFLSQNRFLSVLQPATRDWQVPRYFIR